MTIVGLEGVAEMLKLRGFCWSIGSTRISEHEFRIWPKSSEDRAPVIISNGETFEAAVLNGMLKLSPNQQS